MKLLLVEVVDILHADDPADSTALLRVQIPFRGTLAVERVQVGLEHVDAAMAQLAEVRRLLLSRPDLIVEKCVNMAKERVPNAEDAGR